MLIALVCFDLIGLGMFMLGYVGVLCSYLVLSALGVILGLLLADGLAVWVWLFGMVVAGGLGCVVWVCYAG